jgi:hypothetical protein
MVEISEKNCGYVEGGGTFETGGKTPQGLLEKAPKMFEK